MKNIICNFIWRKIHWKF